MSQQIESRETIEGRAAFQAGLDYFACPYFPARTSEERWKMYRWTDGYESAEREQKEAEENGEREAFVPSAEAADRLTYDRRA